MSEGEQPSYVTAEVKSMMRQRDYLRGKASKTASKVRGKARGKASKTGSKYLRQAFQYLCNKVDYTLRN